LRCRVRQPDKPVELQIKVGPCDSELRDRAARLLALALQAREDGKLLLPEEIIKLAAEASDQADEMDRRDLQVQHQQPAHHQPAQQQQQQPPSEETDKSPGAERR
jgi:hypothetical protein